MPAFDQRIPHNRSPKKPRLTEELCFEHCKVGDIEHAVLIHIRSLCIRDIAGGQQILEQHHCIRDLNLAVCISIALESDRLRGVRCAVKLNLSDVAAIDIVRIDSVFRCTGGHCIADISAVDRFRRLDIMHAVAWFASDGIGCCPVFAVLGDLDHAVDCPCLKAAARAVAECLKIIGFAEVDLSVAVADTVEVGRFVAVERFFAGGRSLAVP